MPFLPPNQQRQSTEGISLMKWKYKKILTLTGTVDFTVFGISVVGLWTMTASRRPQTPWLF